MTTLDIGFTGTRNGMTKEQRYSVCQLMFSLPRVYGLWRFHHGDCIGADAEAHDLARIYKTAAIIGHPPTSNKYRAFKKCDFLREPKPYLARDRDIVEESDIIIATPGEYAYRTRSGTWYTIKQTEDTDKSLYVIYPNGEWGDSISG